MKKLLTIFSFFDLNRAIHSVKTVIACLLGFAVARLLHVANQQWIIITILVVMCAQSRVGALMQKSYMRFLGTLIGGVIAALALFFFGSDLSVIILTLCLATLWFSYIAESPSALSDAGTIGVVTVAIILLSPQQSLSLAIDRFLEINLGIVIALLVSRFVWPLHSRTRLLNSIASTLIALKDFYALINQEEFIQSKIIDIDYEEAIVSGLIKQRKLFEEAARESFTPIPVVIEFKNILFCEREILRDISFIYYALHSVSKETFLALRGCAVFNELHVQITNAIMQAAAALQTKNMLKSNVLVTLPADWKRQIRDSINAVSGEVLEEDILHVDSSLYCAERLLQQLISLLEEIDKLFVSEKKYEKN